MLARSIYPACLVAALALTGCSRNQAALNNPFTTADRVPPPATQLPPGTAQPYYPAPPAGATTTFAAPQAAAPLGQPGFGGAPAATFQQQPAPPFQSVAPTQAAPFGTGVAPPASTPFGSSTTLPNAPLASNTPGDAVAIPVDNTALRFGAPAKPAPINPREPTSLASRTASASGWISGSAPVRSTVDTGGSVLAAAPRVRMPGGESLNREPVNVARIQPESDETVGWR